MKCFACDKRLNIKTQTLAWTLDGQSVSVGPDCYQHVKNGHTAGYQPPLGGPRLYTRVVYMWHKATEGRNLK